MSGAAPMGADMDGATASLSSANSRFWSVMVKRKLPIGKRGGTVQPGRELAQQTDRSAAPSAERGMGLLEDLRKLIREAQHAAAAAVNVSLTMLYWRMGKRIREEVLGLERADYGEQIVATVSRQLAWSSCIAPTT